MSEEYHIQHYDTMIITIFMGVKIMFSFEKYHSHMYLLSWY